MGRIRALSAARHSDCQVSVVVDNDPARAEALALEVGGTWAADWKQALATSTIDAVAVCTPHKFLAPVAVAALDAGKRVFCEKPMGRSHEEGRQLLDAVRRADAGLSYPAAVVGYTLRHHPAVRRAHRLLTEGAVGQPFYIRAAYGHGGRPGYDREWRTDPE